MGKRASSYKVSPELRTADLRYPIALLKCARKPVEGDVTWTTGVKPYYNAFAAFEEGIRKPARGDEADSKPVHTFVIRYDPDVVIEAADFVVFETTLYLVKGIRQRRGRVEFVEIHTNIWSVLATSGISPDETIDIPVAPTDRSNPFFTD